jgi:hypothetical protein
VCATLGHLCDTYRSPADVTTIAAMLGSALLLLGPVAQEDPASTAPAADEARARVEVSPGEGATITSKDGDFELGIGLFTQLLYTVENDVGTEDTNHSFTVRRARVKLAGHTFGDHNKYFVHLAFSPRDLQIQEGTPTKSPIFDWYLDFDHIRDLTVRIGQYRVPFSRQRRIPIGNIMMADRALGNFEFNLDRDVGLSVRSDDIGGIGYLRYEVGAFIGEGRDAFLADDLGMLYVARVEVLPLGMFADYDETDRTRGRRPRLSIGAAYAYMPRAKGNRGILGPPPSDGGTTETHNVTADVMLKIHGLTLSGELYWRDGTRDFGAATIDDPGLGTIPAPLESARDGLGWYGQVGWLVPKIDLELGARYGFVRELGDDSSLPPRDEVAASIGYLIYGKALKIVTDYARGWPENDLDAGTHQARVQLQAAF